MYPILYAIGGSAQFKIDRSYPNRPIALFIIDETQAVCNELQAEIVALRYTIKSMIEWASQGNLNNLGRNSKVTEKMGTNG